MDDHGITTSAKVIVVLVKSAIKRLSKLCILLSVCATVAAKAPVMSSDSVSLSMLRMHNKMLICVPSSVSTLLSEASVSFLALLKACN